MNRIQVLAAGLIVSGLCIGGCGSSVPTGSVSGKVTINGKELPSEAIISFISESGSVASATVSGTGEFKLKHVTSAGPSENIPVGSYKAFITPKTDEGGPSEDDYDAFMEASAADTASKPSKANDGGIPKKYHSAATSGLAFEVKEGENTFDVPLN